MKIYLVRHAHALPASVNPDRPLSEEGLVQTRRVAAFLQDAHLEIDEILHSTKLRAKQTAEILKEVLSLSCPMQAREGLAPDDPPEEIYNAILKSGKNMMIVGHLPFLDKLVSLLVAGNEDRHVVKFKESTLAILEPDVPPAWRIVSYISPEILGA